MLNIPGIRERFSYDLLGFFFFFFFDTFLSHSLSLAKRYHYGCHRQLVKSTALRDAKFSRYPTVPNPPRRSHPLLKRVTRIWKSFSYYLSKTFRVRFFWLWFTYFFSFYHFYFIYFFFLLVFSFVRQVSGIVGRADILTTLFFLVSFISHDRYVLLVFVGAIIIQSLN